MGNAGVEPIVALRDVSHFFGEGTLRRQILFDVSVEILPGEIVTVMGPSGSGKTTLLNLIGTLRTVVHGSARVLGVETREATSAEITRLRQRLGFVFQKHHLLDALTAAQNVQMGLVGAGQSKRVSLERARDMLALVGLRDYVDSRPDRLSGGQCQRVAIARALVRDPDLILADEPTASLDKQTGRDVAELLRTLARERGCAVILVTHDPRILDLTDRLMYLEDGRISSFAAMTSTHAVHLLTSLRPVVETGGLRSFLGRLSQSDFVDMMRRAAAESEQFLNVWELGTDMDSMLVFLSLARAALDRVRTQVEAAAARLWTRVAADGLLCVAGAPTIALDYPPSALAALRTGTLQVERDTVCIPLQDRDYACNSVLELEGVRSADFAERTLRDFIRPFGVLAQACERFERPRTPASPA